MLFIQYKYKETVKKVAMNLCPLPSIASCLSVDFRTSVTFFLLACLPLSIPNIKHYQIIAACAKLVQQRLWSLFPPDPLTEEEQQERRQLREQEEVRPSVICGASIEPFSLFTL